MDETDIAMHEFRSEGDGGSRTLADFIDNDGADIYEGYKNLERSKLEQ